MTTLSLTLIKRDGGLQPRAQLNEEVIAEYREIIKHQHATLPPVAITYDGANHWLTDGYHRSEAYRQEGIDCIPVSITPGSYRDAVLASCKANATHGLRRTNEDKHRQVLRLLRDSEWKEWSDRKIAEHCQVGHPLVASLRKSLTGISSSEGVKPQQNQGGDARRYTTKHGSTATMRTENIGKRPKPTLTLGKQVYQFIANNHPVTVAQVYEGLARQGLIAKNEENLLAVKEMIGGFIDNGDLESDWIIDDEPPRVEILAPSLQAMPVSPVFTDALGRIVPTSAFPVFDNLTAPFSAMRQLVITMRERWNQITTALTTHQEVKGFKGYLSIKGTMEHEIPLIIRQLHDCLPYATCPYCKCRETDCRVCGGSGVVTEGQYTQAPPQLKNDSSLTLKELNAREGVSA